MLFGNVAYVKRRVPRVNDREGAATIAYARQRTAVADALQYFFLEDDSSNCTVCGTFLEVERHLIHHLVGPLNNEIDGLWGQ